MKSYGILRFVKKPELRETKEGVKFCNFVLCWNERRKDNKDQWVDTPHFFDFEIWSDGAEVMCKNYDIGDPIFVEQCTPRVHTWEDKETKKPRSRVVFRLDKFLPCPRAKREETQGVE